jgi:hypothetical protein
VRASVATFGELVLASLALAPSSITDPAPRLVVAAPPPGLRAPPTPRDRACAEAVVRLVEEVDRARSVPTDSDAAQGWPAVLGEERDALVLACGVEATEAALEAAHDRRWLAACRASAGLGEAPCDRLLRELRAEIPRPGDRVQGWFWRIAEASEGRGADAPPRQPE